MTPTWRARDVTREVDVVEEIARKRLEDVPFTLPARREMFGALTPLQRLRRRVEDVLVGLGLTETYTPSLRPDDPDPSALAPSRADLGRAGGAEDAPPPEPRRGGAPQRRARGRAGSSSSRSPASTWPDGELPDEQRHVAAIVEGGWGRAKGLVETLYAALNAEPAFERADDELLHPGKAASLGSGLVGELHPAVLEGVWGAFELDLADLLARSPEDVRYADVASFPALHQDLAFAVSGGDQRGASLAEAAREAAGPELRAIRPFDVYRGEQVGDGRKSVAFAVSFQSAGAHAHRRGRGSVARARSSPPCASASAPSFEPRSPRARALGQRDQHLALDIRRVVHQAA